LTDSVGKKLETTEASGVRYVVIEASAWRFRRRNNQEKGYQFEACRRYYLTKIDVLCSCRASYTYHLKLFQKTVGPSDARGQKPEPMRRLNAEPLNNAPPPKPLVARLLLQKP
jgi:hypothetical protein